MSAPDLIRTLLRSGVRLERRGDRLHVEAPAGTLTADLRQVLTERKAELLGALAENDDSLGAMRVRLLALTDTESINAALVRSLPEADVAECAGLPHETLRAYVLALRDTGLRERGQVPADETAKAVCRHCGPVWTHPAISAAAPRSNGWPRVLGCAWCHIRNRQLIPRPPVECI